MLRALWRSALALFAATTLSAQVTSRPSPSPIAPGPLHEAGRNVTVSLLTMGNGDQVWELFGHTAIWLHDNITGRDTVFNWGVFDSHQPHFIPHFLQGLMLYQMGGSTLDDLLYQYRYFNRSVVSQELDLAPAQKDSLLHLIQINALPENLQYRYDYFVDNCSTRPRDLLDLVLGGQLHAHSSQVTDASYRSEALRLMQGDKPLVVGVHIGLGEPSDRKITMWQEMFLPRRLHDVVGTLQIRDSTGATRPLVRGERVLFKSTRGAEAEAPPNLAPVLTAIGLVLGLLFAWLGVGAATGSRSGQVVAAIVMSIWCLVAGILGLLLTALWTVTDHIFAHRNENLLLFNPLWLVLAVSIAITMWGGRAVRWTRNLAIALAGLTVLALLAHLVMLSSQVNLAVIGLALPPALGIAWAAMKQLARQTTPTGQASTIRYGYKRNERIGTEQRDQR
jgi:hypothetical protein